MCELPKEERLKQKVEEVIELYRGSDDLLYHTFLHLYDQYQKMQKEQDAVVRISDRYQRRMLEIKEELEETNEKLQVIAARDHLTGLYNRQEFERVALREWKHAIRYEDPISMLMVDIDNFKAFNDNYGHLSGDHCLQRLSKAMTTVLKRPRDFLARFGGEEFVIILPDTDSAGAQNVGEEVRQAVIDQHIPHYYSDVAPYVTVSIGIGTTQEAVFYVYEDLLDESDQALFKAKKGGKNQCYHMEI